ncbi:hypothetical protein FZC66_07420 [Priestia megaterium]|nr:hypothetical protein FZC66_07420 [Priestia megaterium]
MVYFILVLVAAIEVITLCINRPAFANIPSVELYILPLLIVIVVSILLSRRPNRIMRVAKQGFITVSIVVLVFVPVIYTKNLPLYSYKEAKQMIAQREQLLLTQFLESEKVYENDRLPTKRQYLFKISRGEMALEYSFDPYTGGFELITNIKPE